MVLGEIADFHVWQGSVCQLSLFAGWSWVLGAGFLLPGSG